MLSRGWERTVTEFEGFEPLRRGIVKSRRLAGLGAAVVTAVAVATLLVPAVRVEAQAFPSQVNRTSTLYLCTSSWYICTATDPGTGASKPSLVATTATSANRADVICWEEGRTTYSQKKWYYVELDFGGEGYIPAPAVTASGTDTSSPPCSSVYRINAAKMALNRSDQTFIGSSDAAILANNLGHPYGGAYGTQGNWSGDCIAFAQLAWWLGGYGGVPTGNAIDVYRTYKGRGWVQPPAGRAPRGALLFWDYGDTYGHVAVSLGNGLEVTTQGYDRDNLPIVVQGIPRSSYVGWVMPFWN